MKVKSIFSRVLIFGGLAAVGGAVFVFRSKLPFDKTKLNLGSAEAIVKNLVGSLNIDTNHLASEAQKKLIERQPIIEDKKETSGGEVAGVSTTFTEQIRPVIQSAAEKAYAGFQNLPKDQAVKLTRQVCDQIVTELEKKATSTPTE